jgi:hypothetical protein
MFNTFSLEYKDYSGNIEQYPEILVIVAHLPFEHFLLILADFLQSCCPGCEPKQCGTLLFSALPADRFF